MPPFLFKYGGSVLWAIALYWFLAALLPKLRPLVLGILAAATATLLECSRLAPIPVVDAFRLTLAGKILLGRYFSLKDIAAYWIAILTTALFDHFASPGRRVKPGIR